MTTSAENDATTIGALRGPLEGRSAVLARRRPLRQRLRLPLMLAGPILVLFAAGYWYLTGGRYVSTDDAYIQAARVAISTDISGRVVEIKVNDNQKVTAGQVLFRLDPRPFQIAVEEAKAQLATVRFQIHAMKATYHQKRADARATEATVDYQQHEFERQQRLVASGTASQQQFDQAGRPMKPGARNSRPSSRMSPSPSPTSVAIRIFLSSNTRWCSTHKLRSTAPSSIFPIRRSARPKTGSLPKSTSFRSATTSTPRRRYSR